MEIERKFLVKSLPENLKKYPYEVIEQGYLCTEPVVRIRRQNTEYILTYNSKCLLAREEYNLPLTRESYAHLRDKIDGRLIAKTRYRIPLNENLTAELDIFTEAHEGLILVEVEFSSEEQAGAFLPPAWFGKEVTYLPQYHNSTLSQA